MTELTITRVLDAPAEKVWRAFTDPAALAAWFWPASFGTTATATVAVDGAYRIAAVTPAMAVSGRYLEVDPPHRLVFTWRWDGDTVDSEVRVDLTAAGDKTELVVRHRRLASDVDRDNHAQGWNDCLDRLPGWLAR
jgi:uncharacterized protein YndB with AHSA1/START domain